MRTNLQKLREMAGYRSAKAFAVANGIAVSTYTDHEQGRRGLSLETAWRYADILGCTLDELAGRDFPVVRYADERQAVLNRDFELLDEPSKDAAVAAIEGMAAASIRGEAKRAQAARNSTA